MNVNEVMKNFTGEYRNKLKLAAKKQWQKVKQTGHNGHLIKV